MSVFLPLDGLPLRARLLILLLAREAELTVDGWTARTPGPWSARPHRGARVADRATRAAAGRARPALDVPEPGGAPDGVTPGGYQPSAVHASDARSRVPRRRRGGGPAAGRAGKSPGGRGPARAPARPGGGGRAGGAGGGTSRSPGLRRGRPLAVVAGRPCGCARGALAPLAVARRVPVVVAGPRSSSRNHADATASKIGVPTAPAEVGSGPNSSSPPARGPGPSRNCRGRSTTSTAGRPRS